MSAVLQRSMLLTLPGIPNATSLQASEVGVTRSGSLDGLMTSPCGREVAPASLSARQESAGDLLTSVTSGPISSASSASVVLTSALVNRLQAKMGLLGSTLYALTWKKRTTPAGRSIPALRASVRRTSGNDCTGWPTPSTTEQGENVDTVLARKERHKAEGRKTPGLLKLGPAAQLAGWPTPQATPGTNNANWKATDGRATPNKMGWAADLTGWPTPQANKTTKNSKDPQRMKEGGVQTALADAAWIAGWPTPVQRDYKGATPGGRIRNGKLSTDTLDAAAQLTGPARLTVTGEMLTGSTAEMESGGQLNPAHSRWLMGYPPEWCDCAVMAMQLFPKSRRRS